MFSDRDHAPTGRDWGGRRVGRPPGSRSGQGPSRVTLMTNKPTAESDMSGYPACAEQAAVFVPVLCQF